MKRFWTQEDERRMTQMGNELSDLTARRKAAIEKVALALRGAPNGDILELAHFLVTNADSVLDALAPFDSGIRLAEDAA